MATKKPSKRTKGLRKPTKMEGVKTLKSSPALLSACANGAHFKTVTIY